jgi:phage terminase large subunit-like protein
VVDVRSFISCLRHSRGEHAGKPFSLFPWQDEYLDRLFNTLRDDGSRQYRTSFLAIPRKNGKTQLSAAVGLYGLFADREPGAEIVCVAGDREQASHLFEAAKQMVEGSETLSKIGKIYRKAITVPETNSVLKVISSEAATKHGYGCSMILFDEFHVQKDRELYDVLQTSTGARRQPLTVLITTAGFDRNSICYQIWQYAEKVRDGVIDDPTFLPCIYAADQTADPFDEGTWRLANPNYGVTVRDDYFRKMAAQAKESAADEMTFRRLHLNQWTASEVKWLKHGAWESCSSRLRDTADRPCYCGLDLGSTFDTTAFVAVWPFAEPDGTTSFDIEAMFWIPEENADRRDKQDRVPYSQWVKDGFVKLTEGDVTDYDAIRDYVLAFCDRHWVKGIAVDRWNAVHLMTQLSAEGQAVHPFGQGYGQMNAPFRLLENSVLSGKVRHAGNPVLTWQASNVQIKSNEDGLIKPTKKHSHDVGRIDGIVACCMALGLASGEMPGQPQEPEIMVI